MMGSPASESGRDKDESQHRVRIKAFKLSQYETTFEEYDAFARDTDRELPDVKLGSRQTTGDQR